MGWQAFLSRPSPRRMSCRTNLTERDRPSTLKGDEKLSCSAYHDRCPKNKPPVVVPPAALRRAGFKRGQDLEVKASGGVVTIMPKLSPDELQDEREIRDPKIRAAIREGHAEFLAGKTRPIESFFAERASRARKRTRRHPGA